MDLGEPVAGAILVGRLRVGDLVVILFALYDALAVIREERSKARSMSIRRDGLGISARIREKFANDSGACGGGIGG